MFTKKITLRLILLAAVVGGLLAFSTASAVAAIDIRPEIYSGNGLDDAAIVAAAGTKNLKLYTGNAPEYLYDGKSYRIDGADASVLAGVTAIVSDLGLDAPKAVVKVFESGSEENPGYSYVDFYLGLSNAAIVDPQTNPYNGSRYFTFELSDAFSTAFPDLKPEEIAYYAMKSGQQFTLWSFDPTSGVRNAAFVDIHNPPLRSFEKINAAVESDNSVFNPYLDENGQFNELLLLSRAEPSNLQFFVITKDTTTNDVPEPATLAIWSLFGAGAAAVGAVRRRRGWTNTKRQAIYNVIDRHSV